AGRAEHHAVAGRRPAIGMGGRVGVMIGLDLHDGAADAAKEQGGADQVGRDLVHAAAEEGTLEGFSEARRGGLRRFETFNHFEAGISRHRAGMVPLSGLFCQLSEGRVAGFRNTDYLTGSEFVRISMVTLIDPLSGTPP